MTQDPKEPKAAGDKPPSEVPGEPLKGEVSRTDSPGAGASAAPTAPPSSGEAPGSDQPAVPPAPKPATPAATTTAATSETGSVTGQPTAPAGAPAAVCEGGRAAGREACHAGRCRGACGEAGCASRETCGASCETGRSRARHQTRSAVRSERSASACRYRAPAVHYRPSSGNSRRRRAGQLLRWRLDGYRARGKVARGRPLPARHA